MTTPALAHGVAVSTRGPRVSVWLAIALAGCAAACASVLIAHRGDHLSEPALQVALLNWITLPYIAAGTIAWLRRPDSRFGPLMIAAGFAIFLSSLQWTTRGVSFTIGMAFDLLPAALLLHLFLAFPSGRLKRGVERALVAAAYAAAVGLQIVKMLLWGLGGRNLPSWLEWIPHIEHEEPRAERPGTGAPTPARPTG